MHEFIRDALSRFGCVAEAPPALIGAGTLNHNYLVRTERGPFVLRRIRDDQPDAQVALEHETIRWVGARGMPVPVPLTPIVDAARTAGDELPETCIRIESDGSDGATEVSRWALFPFVDGRRVRRGYLDESRAAALGDVHGRLHALLHEHPRTCEATFTMQWSVEQSAAALGRIDSAARASGASAEALDGIALQRRLLEAFPVRPPSAFAGLPCQWLHGDFHVEQALFGGESSIVALLDWELCQGNARAWELVRSLSFSGLLDGDPLDAAYLRAYRQWVPIDRDELTLGLWLWWQSRVVGVWVWWAAFVAGNARVHALIPDTVATLHCIAASGWCETMTQRILTAARL